MTEQSFSPANGIPHVPSQYTHSDWRDGVDIDDLCAALRELAGRFPGWGYGLGLCSMTADCTLFPDHKGQDAPLLERRVFDDGFHVSVYDGTQAEALRYCMALADQARKEADVERSS
jgi:hypothetical protein